MSTELTAERLAAIEERSAAYMGLWDAVNGEPTARQILAATASAEDVPELLAEVERLSVTNSVLSEAVEPYGECRDDCDCGDHTGPCICHVTGAEAREWIEREQGYVEKAEAEVKRLRGELAERAGWDHLSEDWHSAQRCGSGPCPGCIIELLERERDEADEEGDRRSDAIRQAAIAGFAEVRAALLGALGIEDDRRTQLVGYVAELTGQRDAARAELARAREEARQLDLQKQDLLIACDEADLVGRGTLSTSQVRKAFALTRPSAVEAPAPDHREDPRQDEDEHAQCGDEPRCFDCGHRRCEHSQHGCQVNLGDGTWCTCRDFDPYDDVVTGGPVLGGMPEELAKLVPLGMPPDAAFGVALEAPAPDQTRDEASEVTP